MFSVVPVLDELLSIPSQPYLRNQVSLLDDFRNQLGHDQEVKTIEDNSKQLTLAVNCHQFKPENIKVKIVNNYIQIDGDFEQKDEHSYVKRQFSRKFQLPANAIQEKMNCSLSQNGVLKITIPKQQKAVQGDSVNIPIQFSK